jgi:hypothetical protein
MIRRIRAAAILLAACATIASASAMASGRGFVKLFNGRDLAGWTQVGVGAWQIVDGELISASTGHTWLRTTRQFRDFDLRLEYNMAEGGNSGVFIHAPERGRCSRIGFEIQLVDDAGRKPDIHSTTSIYEIQAPRRNTARPAGQWNRLRIYCKGPRIQVTLNGVLVNDMRTDDSVLNRKGDALHKPAKRREVGFIGLQDHGGLIRFRSIRVRDLSRP